METSKKKKSGRGGPRPGFGGKQPGAGRPKGSLQQVASVGEKRHIAELAREHSKACIDQAVDIMNNSTSDAARMSAIQFLTDRGFGKAPQAIHVEDPDGSLGDITKGFASLVASLSALSQQRVPKE